MIDAIQNGIMESDLDANHHAIINLGSIISPPGNLVQTDDPRLSDARDPIPGSVSDASIADDASIQQSKLNLTGSLPPSWIGTTSDTAARGDLAEYVANKGVPGGYAGLDDTGKVLPEQLPGDVGLGTVTSVDLITPPELSVSNTPVTTSGTILLSWNAIPSMSWFGNLTGASAIPSFNTNPIPSSLIPDLPASRITSGTIDPARLPVAVGIGINSSSGAVPDPGPTGNPTDYLGRDMVYHPVPTIGPSYQPVVADPILIVIASGPPSIVSVTPGQPGESLFYKLSVTPPTTYVPVTSSVSVPGGETLSAYAAKVGYTNSSIVTYTI